MLLLLLLLLLLPLLLLLLLFLVMKTRVSLMPSAFNVSVRWSLSACPAGQFFAMIAAAALGAALGAAVGLVAARFAFNLQCAAPRVHVQQGTRFWFESK